MDIHNIKKSMHSLSKFLFLSIFCFFIVKNTNIQAQNSEVGFWVGSNTYFGDINPDFNPLKTLPAAGLMYRYDAHEYVGLRLGLMAGWIRHDDASSKNPFQQIRNLSFNSPIVEISGQIDLHFKKFKLGSKKYFFTPYLTAGIAAFYFDPITKLDGKIYKLHEYGTEGQRASGYLEDKPYNRIQPAIPLGLGFKYWMFHKWSFYVEAAYRQTFTDYLDDVSNIYIDTSLFYDDPLTSALADRSGEVSDVLVGVEGKQRGDVTNKDGYLNIQIGLTYTIVNKRCVTPK